MKTILVPIDGSARALDALRVVLRDGSEALARIELLNVQPRLHRHIAERLSRGARDRWRAARAEAALAPARRLLATTYIPWRSHVRVGDVPEQIDAAATLLRCDEIAIGTARHSPFGRWLANSVSARLLARATVPVRVVPVAPAPPLERYAIPAGLGLIALLLLADE